MGAQIRLTLQIRLLPVRATRLRDKLNNFTKDEIKDNIKSFFEVALMSKLEKPMLQESFLLSIIA